MSFLKKFNNLNTNRRFVSASQNRFIQLGTDIDGEAATDLFGWSVSMNAAGDRIVIGGIQNDGTGSNAGHARVYSWNGTSWTQLGADIDGEAAGDNFGSSVSINAAGDRVAIGARYNSGVWGSFSGHVRVYSWNGTSWTQLGADIDGSAANDQSGRWSISMNATGDIVAIGATAKNGINGTSSGHVRVFSWDGTNWVKMGNDIFGSAAFDFFGRSVSINAAGNIVAIGANGNDANGAGSGQVRVHFWSGVDWQQMGSDIYGEAANDASGVSVSLNAAGTIVAIGADSNDGNGTDSGHVRVYFWNGANWVQLGEDINGEAATDLSGTSVSINAIGNRVAIGAIQNDGTGSNAGHVRIYSWNGTIWTQLGADIDGEAANDLFGRSISMNAAGDRVAIGAYQNDGMSGNASDNRGHVRVYYDYIGNSWKQFGQNIDGEASGDQSGFSVSMNAAGDRVAIGATNNDGSFTNAGHVRVYSWNGTIWTQLGADIDGEFIGDQSGNSISINAAGDRVAIGAQANDGTGSNAGHVRVYSWNGTNWIKLGADIDGEAANDFSGCSVSINAAGDRVAIGARYNSGSGSYAGHVRVYSWNGTNWIKLGADIDGEFTGDQSGFSVSMNAAGNRVAIGAIENDQTGSNAGHVRIYSWNGTIWTQLGADIDGEATTDLSGYSVSMNAAGDRVAIGAIQNNGAGWNDSGHVRIYSWNGTIWTQLGADIDGEADYDGSGISVSMNADGNMVAIGADKNNAKGLDSGYVRIFYWNGTSWTRTGLNIDGEAANDFSGFSVSLNAAGDMVAIGAYGNDGTTGNVNDNRGRVRTFFLNVIK